MNKKAGVFDWFLIIAMVILISIVVLVCFIVIDKVSSISIFADDADAAFIVNQSKNTILAADNIMLFIIVGLSLAVLISSAVVFNHPAFFIFSFFLLCIAIMVAATMSNAFWTFANQSTVIATASNFPKIIFLMNKLPFYILFMGVAAIIAGYISYRDQ